MGFYRDKRKPDGLYLRCRQCHITATEKWRDRNRDRVNEIARRSRSRNIDKVRARNRVANRQRYHADPQVAARIKARTRQWYAANKAVASEYHKARRQARADEIKAYLRDYYARNAETIKARTRARELRERETLKPYNAARSRARQALKQNAIPPWADLKAIIALYDEANRLTAETGIVHEVDHMVPLQSKRVCGLHCEANLHILTREANRAKSNRYWPDCPEDIAMLMVPKEIRAQVREEMR